MDVQFYSAHVLYQTSLQHYGVVAVMSLARSLLAAAVGNHTGAIVEARASLVAMDALFAAQRAAEGNGG